MNKDRSDVLLQEIREHRGDLYPIFARLRDIALSSGSNITEEVKYGGLMFSSRRVFCGIIPYKAHVTLEFGEGASLPDPHGVLSGSGKQRRNIKLQKPSDIEEKKVAYYVGMARQEVDSDP